MTERFEDMAPFLVSSNRNEVKRTQGIIQSWNTETFENAVIFNGLTAFNVPVASGVEALTYKAGDVVVLEGYAPENATGSWMITGRVISPGSGAAEQTIEWMTTNLGAAIARSVIANSVFTNRVSGIAGRNSDSFGDPNTGGIPGPSLTDIELVTGNFVALVSSDIQADSESSGGPQDAGLVGIQVSGSGGTISPSIDDAAVNFNSKVGTISTNEATQSFATITRVFTSNGQLDPGTYTFTLKYAKHAAASQSLFFNRILTVIAF